MDINIFYNKGLAWLQDYGPRVVIAIIVLIAGQWLIRAVRRYMEKGFKRRRLDISVRPFLIGLVVTLMQIFLVLMVLQVAGIQMTIFAALLGGVGIAFGLALSGTLQNFTSGLLILVLKPFHVGDVIMAQGEEGTVTMIRTFYTVITTHDNKTVIIPNSKLSNEVILNLSRQGTLRIDVLLKFSYVYSFEEVKSVIEKTIANSKDILGEPKSRIGIEKLDAEGYEMAVQVWAMASNFIEARLNLQARILADLKAAGIKLPGMPHE